MAPLSGAISIWESAHSRRLAKRLRHKRTMGRRALEAWHNEYKNAANTRSKKQKRNWRIRDGHGAGNNGPYSRARQRHVSLGAIGDRRSGHGDDRQLPIWLDVLRPRHSENFRL